MNLGTKTRYAVMAMVEMASRGGEYPVALAELAKSQEITLPYLEQIFRKLKADSLVKATRGPGGGYLLARPAEMIRISDIVEAVEESMKMTRCEAHKTSGCMSNKSRCLTHDLWDGLGMHIHDYLAAITLADVCNKKTKKSA